MMLPCNFCLCCAVPCGYFCWLRGEFFIIQNIGVDVGSLLAGLGIGGLAMALAAQESLANFFGSLVLLVDRPFKVGDWITVDGVDGDVEEMGFSFNPY